MNIVVYNSFLIICILMDQLVRMILSSLQLVAREGNYLWLNLRRFIVLRPSLYFVYFLSSPILLLKCHSNAHYYLTYQQVIISIPMINSMIITISITIDFMDVIWVCSFIFLSVYFFMWLKVLKKQGPSQLAINMELSLFAVFSSDHMPMKSNEHIGQSQRIDRWQADKQIMVRHIPTD